MYSALNTISTIGSLTSIFGVLVLFFVIFNSLYSSTDRYNDVSNVFIIKVYSFRAFLSIILNDFPSRNNLNFNNVVA